MTPPIWGGGLTPCFPDGHPARPGIPAPAVQAQPPERVWRRPQMPGGITGLFIAPRLSFSGQQTGGGVGGPSQGPAAGGGSRRPGPAGIRQQRAAWARAGSPEQRSPFRGVETGGAPATEAAAPALCQSKPVCPGPLSVPPAGRVPFERSEGPWTPLLRNPLPRPRRKRRCAIAHRRGMKGRAPSPPLVDSGSRRPGSAGSEGGSASGRARGRRRACKAAGGGGRAQRCPARRGAGFGGRTHRSLPG